MSDKICNLCDQVIDETSAFTTVANGWDHMGHMGCIKSLLHRLAMAKGREKGLNGRIEDLEIEKDRLVAQNGKWADQILELRRENTILELGQGVDIIHDLKIEAADLIDKNDATRTPALEGIETEIDFLKSIIKSLVK